MFVILTSKAGQFTTELGEGIEPVEVYDFLTCGRRRARFVIARLAREVKIRIVDDATPSLVNRVPSKFLPKFDSLEKARAELNQLLRGGTDSRLVKQ